MEAHLTEIKRILLKLMPERTLKVNPSFASCQKNRKKQVLCVEIIKPQRKDRTKPG